MNNNLSNDENYIILLEKNQHKVLGRVERDTATLRLSVAVMIQNPDGRLSEPVTIQRSKLLTAGEKELLWICDSSGNFDLDDLKSVRGKLLKLLEKPSGEIVETADKATATEILEKLSGYIISKSELLSPDGKIILVPTIFSKNGYGYIETKKFSEFISNHKDMGWSRLEVLKLLKRNSLLQIGKDRTYDKKIKLNGKCGNYYVIQLPHDKQGNIHIEEPDETIEIKLNGESKDAD